MSTEIKRRLFTIHDYLRMDEAGIFVGNDRVELINGEVLAMSPQGSRHYAAVDRACKAMMNGAGDDAIVRTQGSVGLDEYSVPQPDVVLLRPKDDFYATKLPGPSDILLIVEVAESSLKYDRTVKLRLYAETGVPDYWIADISNDCLFAYSKPKGKSYRVVQQHHRGSSIAPQLLPACRVPIDSLLP